MNWGQNNFGQEKDDDKRGEMGGDRLMCRYPGRLSLIYSRHQDFIKLYKLSYVVLSIKCHYLVPRHNMSQETLYAYPRLLFRGAHKPLERRCIAVPNELNLNKL